MRRVVSLFIIFLILTACSKSQVKNGWEQNELQGKVKSIKEYSYAAVFNDGEITKGVRQRNAAPGAGTDKVMTFDQQGNLLEEKNYNSDNSLTASVKYTYDGGKKKEENWYDADGKLYLNIKYNYNLSGNLKDQERYDPEGKLTGKHTYAFDKNGNKSEEHWLDADGNEESSWKFDYDNNGHLIEENWFDAAGNVSYNRTLRYDSAGNLSGQSWHVTRGADSEWTYDYNDKNFRVGTSVSFDNRSSISQKYDLDQNGNWTRAILFEEDQPIFIIEREIEYFK